MADRDDNVDIDQDYDSDADYGGMDDMVDAPRAPNGNGNGSRASLREAWDSSPVLKIAAIALGAAVLLGGYFTIFGGSSEDNSAIVATPAQTNVSSVPGTEDTDPEFRRALEELNQQEAIKAAETGGSALPVPIGTAAQSGLTVPAAPDAADADPLSQWRRDAESRRLAMEQQVLGDEEPDEGVAPDIIPMVQPVRPTPQVARMDPEAPKRLAAQMRVIIAAQAPVNSRVAPITQVPSAYTLMKKAEEEQAQAYQAQGGIQTASAGGSQAAPAFGDIPSGDVDKVIVSAGSIIYGQLMNQLNSDLPGPVLVSLLSGPFAGGRAIGKLEVRQDYMVLTFNKVIKDGVVYTVQGIALDEETTLTGHRSSVDHHYFTRVILPAAAEFVKGYAGAVAETGTSSTTTGGGGVVQDTPEPDATEEVYKGVEEAGDRVSEILEDESDRPVTVHLDKGTTLGILLMDFVTTGNAN